MKMRSIITCADMLLFLLLSTTLLLLRLHTEASPLMDTWNDAATVAAAAASSCVVVDVDGRCDNTAASSSIIPAASADDVHDNDNKDGIVIPDLPDLVNNLVETGYGEPQLVQGLQADQTYQHIVEMHQYMYEDVYHNAEFPYPEHSHACINQHSNCAYWATRGECQANEAYMVSQCGPACFSCETMLLQWRYPGVGSKVEEVLDTGYGVAQHVMVSHSVATWQLIDSMDRYMHDVVYADNYPYPKIRAECQNRHELCALLAMMGECTSNAAYMKVMCAPACLSCDQLAA